MVSETVAFLSLLMVELESEDILDVIVEGKADAVSFASILHYETQGVFKDLDDIDEGSEFLKNRKILEKLLHDIKHQTISLKK